MTTLTVELTPADFVDDARDSLQLAVRALDAFDPSRDSVNCLIEYSAALADAAHKSLARALDSRVDGDRDPRGRQ